MPRDYHDHSGDRHQSDQRYSRAELDATWSGDVWDQALLKQADDDSQHERDCDEGSDD